MKDSSGPEWARPLCFTGNFDALSAAHAAKQNPEFSLHVSALGPKKGYYYMHRNALFRTNRINWLLLDMGRGLTQ
jgi:hypothetical protein